MDINGLKRGLCLFISCFCLSCSYTQTIGLQTVTSGASNFSQSNGSLSFTVGELVVTTEINSSGYSLGNGFIPSAVYSNTVVAIDKPDSASLDVKVYPNPTNDLLFVDVFSSQLDYMRIDIVDLKGKLIFSEKYIGMVNRIGINSARWPGGSYFLILKDLNNRAIGNYQIMKIAN